MSENRGIPLRAVSIKMTWIVVAGKSGARVFSFEPEKKDFWTLALSIEHPSGRLREQEMVSDRGAGRTIHRRVR